MIKPKRNIAAPQISGDLAFQNVAQKGPQIDFRNFQFQRLDSHDEVKFEKYCGPTPESNWVIPGKILVGAYPASVDDSETFDLLTSIMLLGVTRFVCLQQEYRTKGVTEYMWRNGQALRPYFEDVKAIAREKDSFPWLTGLKDIPSETDYKFVHFPIKDCSVTDDDRVMALCIDLVRFVSEGEVMYVHCWGGHGRTGTVISIMLHLMYGLSADQSMAFCQLAHDLRQCPVVVGSPQTQTQRDQVTRVISKLIALAAKHPVKPLPSLPLTNPSTTTTVSVDGANGNANTNGVGNINGHTNPLTVDDNKEDIMISHNINMNDSNSIITTVDHTTSSSTSIHTALVGSHQQLTRFPSPSPSPVSAGRGGSGSGSGSGSVSMSVSAGSSLSVSHTHTHTPGVASVDTHHVHINTTTNTETQTQTLLTSDHTTATDTTTDQLQHQHHGRQSVDSAMLKSISLHIPLPTRRHTYTNLEAAGVSGGDDNDNDNDNEGDGSSNHAGIQMAMATATSAYASNIPGIAMSSSHITNSNSNTFATNNVTSNTTILSFTKSASAPNVGGLDTSALDDTDKPMTLGGRTPSPPPPLSPSSLLTSSASIMSSQSHSHLHAHTYSMEKSYIDDYETYGNIDMDIDIEVEVLQNHESDSIHLPPRSSSSSSSSLVAKPPSAPISSSLTSNALPGHLIRRRISHSKMMEGGAGSGGIDGGGSGGGGGGDGDGSAMETDDTRSASPTV
eukprot:gene7878-16121_t